MTYQEFKECTERLSQALTYPELDDLHAVEDYVSTLLQELEWHKRLYNRNSVAREM